MKQLKRPTEVALGCAVLFAAYFVTARLGLLLGAVAGFATLVWPPTGAALAALRLFGFRLWPGVFAAAFFVNLAAGAPAFVALGIASGNTLEAIAGAWLLGRVGFQAQLERIADVLALIIAAAIGSTSLSALIGIASLHLGGIVSRGGAAEALRAWWIGDILGDLVVAPLLFVFTARPPLRARSWMLPELVLLVCALAASGLLVFGNLFGGSISLLRHPYVLFPLLALAALRFGQYGAVVSVFLVSGIAIAGTTLGFGPFAQAFLADSLLDLQAFMGVASATTLVLGAAIAERNRAVEARDEFLSIASHELRTPLTALSLHVQTLLRRLHRSDEGLSREGILQGLEAANRLLARLAKLIGELLEVSRVATGRLKLEREEMDLAASVREGLARFEGQLAGAGCRVELHLEGRLTGSWDRMRLDQVIDNLLSNAAKYGAGKPIEVRLDERGEHVVLEVRDHGIGIDPADQPRIFGQFERAVSERRFGGFGLGLWIARRVVEAHGGSIRLSSQPGVGSTFTVELPR
ncbi:MAG: MASE1 domain-containing protein [Myxococcales bacterium]